MQGILSNPAVLTALFGALGTAVAWLWTQVQKEKTRNRVAIAAEAEKHQKCEIELATMRERMAAQDVEMGRVQATCGTLTELLRREINVG
jgi:uncharacterized protein HemX